MQIYFIELFGLDNIVFEFFFYIGIIVVIIPCSIHRLVHAKGVIPETKDTFSGADSS